MSRSITLTTTEARIMQRYLDRSSKQLKKLRAGQEPPCPHCQKILQRCADAADWVYEVLEIKRREARYWR